MPAARADTATPRERLLGGLAEALRTTDFGDVTVADIVRNARTSRRTFYECFETKQDCFVALVREVNQLRRTAVGAAVDPHAPWRTQIHQALEALLSAVQLEPDAFVRSIREVHSLGDLARQLVRDDLNAFVDLLLRLCDNPELRAEGITPPDRTTALVLVGGIRELMIGTIESGADPRDLIEPVSRITERLLGPQAPDHDR